MNEDFSLDPNDPDDFIFSQQAVNNDLEERLNTQAQAIGQLADQLATQQEAELIGESYEDIPVEPTPEEKRQAQEEKFISYMSALTPEEHDIAVGFMKANPNSAIDLGDVKHAVHGYRLRRASEARFVPITERLRGTDDLSEKERILEEAGYYKNPRKHFFETGLRPRTVEPTHHKFIPLNDTLQRQPQVSRDIYAEANRQKNIESDKRRDEKIRQAGKMPSHYRISHNNGRI